MRMTMAMVAGLLLLATAQPSSAVEVDCNGTCRGFTCDANCAGGCNASSVGDVCPGVCLEDPWKVCSGSGQCQGNDNLCVDSVAAFTCTGTSPHPGAACLNDLDCCQGNTTCQTSVCNLGSGCCNTSAPQTAMGTDGKKVLCGGGSGETITGDATQNVICGNGGNDSVDGGAGDDLIDGGNGDDILSGGANDDEIFGGDGVDILIGEGGRDVLHGGDDDDLIISRYFASSDNGVLGSILCGDDGADTIFANGPGHQCVDAGTDGGACTYFADPSVDDHDIGTQVRCTSSSGFSSTRHPACACQE